MEEMDSVTGTSTVSNSSQKRPAQDAPETMRSKRAKYISTAWYAHMSFGEPLLTCGAMNANDVKSNVSDKKMTSIVSDAPQ